MSMRIGINDGDTAHVNVAMITTTQVNGINHHTTNRYSNKNFNIVLMLLQYFDESFFPKYEDIVNFAVIRPVFDRVSWLN